MAQELKVIADFYTFAVWLSEHTAKFPRVHRYSLGAAIDERVQLLLGLLIRAKYTKQRAELLNRVNVELEVLRFQMRLAADLRALPGKSQGFAAVTMQTIGAQVGGWLRSTADRAANPVPS
ncbi:MAG: diversity-generating retroelement protein Avd [Phycisphaerales bacterium]